MILGKRFTLLMMVALFLLALTTLAAAGVVTYPFPTGVAPSPDFTVTAGGKPVFIQTAGTLHGGPASFGGFDFADTVEVSVKPTRAFTTAKVTPASFGITAKVAGGAITFTLDRPRNVTIELDGAFERPLHLFANPLESGAPKPGDPGVIYFGPGVHELTTMTLPSNTTLYLAGGAILRGVLAPNEKPVQMKNWKGNKVYKNFLVSYGSKNVKICGRGVVDLSGLPWHARTSFVLDRVDGGEIEGITLIDSPAWGMALFSSKNIHINNIKQICARENSDGIDVCNTQNVVVENSFLRNNDDEICVKATSPAPAPISKGIMVKNCVIWNDRARGLGITSETRRDIEDVTFVDCDILHDFAQNGDCGSLAILVSDSGTMRNIRFEKIRIEDCRVLIRCWVGKDMWGHDAARGRVEGVVFKDITAAGKTFPKSAMLGCDEGHAIENVTFDNLKINGKAIGGLEEGKITVNPFVRGVRFAKE